MENNSGTFIIIGKDGMEKKRLTIEDKQSLYLDAYLMDGGGDCFYFTRAVKEDKMGHVTSRYDLNLKETWNYQLTPEKGRHQLVLASAGKNGVTIISKYYKNAFASEAPSSIIFLDPAGKEVSKTEMAGLPPAFDPYMMKNLSDGSVLLVSDYGKSTSVIYPDIPLGMNYRTITSDGGIKQNVNHEFRKFQAAAGPKKEDNTPLYLESPGLRVLEIQENGQRITLVTESYYLKKIVYVPTSQTSIQSSFDSDLTLMDMYVIQADDEMLSNVVRIWKPVRTYQLRNFFSNDMGSVSEELLKYHGFSYQFSRGQDLVIRGYNHNLQYFNTVKAGEHFEDIGLRVFYGKPVAQHSGGDVTIFEVKSDNIDENGVLNKEGLVPCEKGILLYYFNPVTYKLHFSFIPQ